MSEEKDTFFYLRFFWAHLSLSFRQSWCSEVEGLTLCHIFTHRFPQHLCLQGLVQPAEIWDPLDDFWLEARLLIQEAKLFFPGALGGAELWHAGCRGIHPHGCLSVDCPADLLLVCTELQSDKVKASGQDIYSRLVQKSEQQTDAPVFEQRSILFSQGYNSHYNLRQPSMFSPVSVDLMVYLFVGVLVSRFT